MSEIDETADAVLEMVSDKIGPSEVKRQRCFEYVPNYYTESDIDIFIKQMKNYWFGQISYALGEGKLYSIMYEINITRYDTKTMIELEIEFAEEIPNRFGATGRA